MAAFGRDVEHKNEHVRPPSVVVPRPARTSGSYAQGSTGSRGYLLVTKAVHSTGGLTLEHHRGIEPQLAPQGGKGTSPLQSLLLRGPGPLAKG